VNTLRVRTARGALVLHGAEEPLAREALPHLVEACQQIETVARPLDLPSQRAWLKASPLTGRARLRHTLRSWLRISPAPRVREAENLRWLREHDFPAPKPLLAATLERAASVCWQGLLLERLESVAPLPSHWPQASASERGRLLRDLGSDVARMHALRFVHRDLYLRNVLVDTSRESRLCYVDAWRGGPGASWRGPAYDLGCLFLHGAAVFTQDEQRALLDAYFDERARRGAPADRRELLASASRERAALLRQALRDPSRLRTPQPPADWSVEGAAR
jgi:tRNA A-37 threonylcarbamoyl transferase component Bud32